MRRLAFACFVCSACACATYDESVATDVPVDTSAPATPPSPLTLDDAARFAVAHNPDLAALRASLSVNDAQAQRAALWPDPSLSVDVVQPLASTSDSTGASLGVDWDAAELIGVGAEHRAAELAAESARHAVRYQEQLVATEAKLETAKLASLTRQLDVATSARAAADQLLGDARDARAHGDIAVDELGLRTLAAVEAHSREQEIARAQSEADNALRRALGVPPATTLVVAPATTATATATTTATDAASVDALFARARAHREDLRALEIAYASHEQVLWRAVLGQFPSFSIHAEAARDTGRFFAVGGGVSLKVPVLNGNRGEIAVESATRAQLRAELSARLFTTRADIDGLVRTLEHATAQRDVVAQQLPALEKNEAELAAAVKAGDATRAVYAEVRAAVVENRLKLLALDEEVLEAGIALEAASPVAGGEKP